MTLAFELDQDRVKMNQHDGYLSQRSFGLKVIVPTHRHTTQLADCSTWQVVGKKR